MLRITSSLVLLLGATFVTADYNALAQRAVVTARAVLPPRALLPRQNQFTCASATDTVCADGSGCCPQGAACFQSDGVGLCSVTCEAAQPTCVFNGVTACCPNGDSCGGSLCIPAGATALGSMGSSPSSDTTTTTTSTALATATVTMIRSDPTSTSSLSSCTSTVTVYVATPSPISPNSPVINVLDSPVPSPSSSVTALAYSNGTASGTTTQGNSATFTLGTPTVTPPLQVSIAAAPENVKAWSMGSLAGLALFGFLL